MKNLIIILIFVLTLTSCKYLHIFNSVLKLNNDKNVKSNEILSELPPIKKESKWYGFLAYDKKLDIKISFYFEDDSVFFYSKERYEILDTIVWGSPNKPSNYTEINNK